MRALLAGADVIPARPADRLTRPGPVGPDRWGKLDPTLARSGPGRRGWTSGPLEDTMRNAKLDAWVEEVAALCKPDRVHWCDGSAAEHDEMVRLMVHAGTAVPLDEAKRPARECGSW